MNYFYINLDDEQTRAQQVEQQFAACSPQRLQRFSALDSNGLPNTKWPAGSGR